MILLLILGMDDITATLYGYGLSDSVIASDSAIPRIQCDARDYRGVWSVSGFCKYRHSDEFPDSGM